MYKISEYSNKIKNTITNEVFLQDDREVLYSAFLEWRENGGTPEFVDYFEDEDEEYNRLIVPKIVSQRQLRTQLVLTGFDLDSIQTVINTLPQPNRNIAQVAWDYAITFERESELLIGLALALGIDANELDAIFINASQL